jgi:hypothetical protein
MRTPDCFCTLVTAVLLSMAAAPPATAATPVHVRTASPALRTLIDAGIEHSPTFRDLVNQLESSDVVVYVSFKTFDESSLAGRIQFVGSAGGRRYLQIFVAPLPDLACIAILGHELRHAVEIAAAHSVVDAASLARCYARIGFRVAPHADWFDTQDAVECGRRVLRETMSRTRGSDGVRIDALPGSR